MGTLSADEGFTERLQFISDRFRKGLWAASEPFISGYDLHAYHIPVLVAVGDNPGISQKGLREHVMYDKSRISTIIFELTLLKMVEDCSETKVSSLVLTDLGKEVFSGIRSVIADFCSKLLDGISDAEISVFVACLNKIDGNLSAIIGDDSLKM